MVFELEYWQWRQLYSFTKPSTAFFEEDASRGTKPMPKEEEILNGLLQPDPRMAADFKRLGCERFLLEEFGIGPEATHLVDEDEVINAKRREETRQEQIRREE